MDEAIYLGNHGVETWFRGELLRPAGIERFDARLARAHSMLRHALSNVPGLVFEHKGMGFAIHYRLTPSAGEAVASAARSVARRRGLRVLTRTDHVEIRPPVDGDKGSALRKLVASRGIRGLVVMGDDPVDIPAFDAGRAHAESTGARVQLVGVGGRLDSVSLDLRLHDVADACTLLGAVADGLAA